MSVGDVTKQTTFGKLQGGSDVELISLPIFTSFHSRYTRFIQIKSHEICYANSGAQTLQLYL